MIDRKRFAPPGKDCSYIRNLTCLVAVVLTAWSFFEFCNSASGNVSIMKHHGENMILSGEYLWSFTATLGGTMKGFYVCAAAMGAFVVDNYLYFYSGSKSIYTMKRLKSPAEMHLRCWTVPLFWAAALLLLSVILTGIYFLIYWMMVPAPFRPDPWYLIL